MLSNIRIVLVNTSHPGNIGSTARAMKTMGLSRLYLVNPALFPHSEAVALAAGADDILSNAVIVNTLEDAIADCEYVIGTTARSNREVSLPDLTPRSAAQKIMQEAESYQIAVVFGCERFGLTSEELLKCHYQLTIPTNADYSALNLAAAVQVIAYEVFSASQQVNTTLNSSATKSSVELANSEDTERFYQHLTNVLTTIEFYNPENPKRLIPKLRRLFSRIHLEKMEVQMLRGMLREVQRKIPSTGVISTTGAIPAKAIIHSNIVGGTKMDSCFHGNDAKLNEKFEQISDAGRRQPIYLDYMATTPVDPLVKEKMLPYLSSAEPFFGNAGSEHLYGQYAKDAIAAARAEIAALIHAEPNEIIWTSGATESINLALLGAARFYQSKGKHIITVKTEHKAVLDCCQQLEREGFELTYLTPESNGILSLETISHAIRADTILLSIMHVNNEIGVIQDIASIAELTRDKGILFHVDAAQSAGKIPINLKNMKIDLMSFSAHKLYGPKGIGALYVRHNPRVRLKALIYGGGQEQGLRSGTLATHQIVGMGEAFRLAREHFAEDQQQVKRLAACFWQEVENNKLMHIYLNGDKVKRYMGNINISVAGVEGESLMLALNDLALSNASACVSASVEPSYVLRAIGVSDELAHSAIRISFGRFTTQTEIVAVVKLLAEQINRLRNISSGLVVI